MKRILIVFILIVFITIWNNNYLLNAENDFKLDDLQSIKCGMTSDEIESLFQRKLIHSKNFSDQSTFFVSHIFDIRFMSERSYATIGFTNSKVSSVTYRIVPHEQNPEKLIDIWLKIDQLLIDKYGKPELDQIKYINTQTKVSKSTYSYDLSIGNIKLEKIWLTKHLWIQHELYKMNKNVDIKNQSYGHYLRFVCKYEKND